MSTSLFWRFMYTLYPPCLRLLEKIKVHSTRQDFVLGFLRDSISIQDLRHFLLSKGFEHAILAWKDPQEVLSMRKIDREIFQYHLRVYADKEIRGHYEYSSKGNPWGHIMEKKFEPAREYFSGLLKHYLKI